MSSSATLERRDWLDTEQVAELLGVTARTVRAWKAAGILQAVRIGGVVRYRRASLEARLDDLERVQP